jgi:hypothetical protein
MLDSGLFENQVWGALHKAWKGYVIAKNKDEFDKMLHYADIIQECQDDLGLQVSLGLGRILIQYFYLFLLFSLRTCYISCSKIL